MPVCDDTQAMIEGLSRLGATVRVAEGSVEIEGGTIGESAVAVDAGASGTTGRFLTAVACLGTHTVTIDGTPRLRLRPLEPLLHALRSIGASIEGSSLPIAVRGGDLRGGRVQVDASTSSQFVSALALIAPAIEAGLRIEWDSLASRPFVEMTADVMRRFGVHAHLGERSLIVPGGDPYRATEMRVPTDAASAGYPALAAALTGGHVTIPGLTRSPYQPDLLVLDALGEMGCRVEWGSDGVAVHGPETLRAVQIDMGDAPDGALTVAIAAGFAEGTSSISGLGTLPTKESDRLTGLVEGLRAVGAHVEATGSSLTIRRGTARPGRIDARDDHRMAMVFSVAGLRTPGLCVDSAESVAKTWPGFYEDMSAIVGDGWAETAHS